MFNLIFAFANLIIGILILLHPAIPNILSISCFILTGLWFLSHKLKRSQNEGEDKMERKRRNWRN